MRLKTSIVAIAVTTGALLASPTSPAGAAETCFGLAPTIVATPGHDRLVGTEGDDVIVDPFGHAIDALGGDDAICSIGSTYLTAGDGNDKVSMVDAEPGNQVLLGLGSDLFEGSGADERVRANGDDRTIGDPDDVDVINTRGGDDRVSIGRWGVISNAAIDLGGGKDSVVIAGMPGGSIAVQGGAGDDELDIHVPFYNVPYYPAASDLDVDLAEGRVDLKGQLLAVVTDFEDAHLESQRTKIALSGTQGANTVFVGSPDARVRALGGSDRVRLYGCGAVARGGAGADRMRVAFNGCAKRPGRLYGGAGGDSLFGSTRSDVLAGQGGRDSADGRGGRDTCRAEVRRRCERR